MAALLHEVAEILCWCFAPDLVQQAYGLQRTHAGMRSAVAQKAVMGASIQELQLALVREYELPELLVTLMDPGTNQNPRTRTVALACDFARHLGNGWGDAGLPDDIRHIAELVRLDLESVVQKLSVPEERTAEILEKIARSSSPPTA